MIQPFMLCSSRLPPWAEEQEKQSPSCHNHPACPTSLADPSGTPALLPLSCAHSPPFLPSQALLQMLTLSSFTMAIRWFSADSLEPPAADILAQWEALKAGGWMWANPAVGICKALLLAAGMSLGWARRQLLVSSAALLQGALEVTQASSKFSQSSRLGGRAS